MFGRIMNTSLLGENPSDYWNLHEKGRAKLKAVFYYDMILIIFYEAYLGLCKHLS